MTRTYDNATDIITFTRSSSGTALRRAGYGDELVTNGTFDTDTTGWAAFNYQGHSVTISSVSGELTVENDPTNGGTAAAYQAIPTVVGPSLLGLC